MDSLVWPAGLTSDLLSSAQRVLLGSEWPGLSTAQSLVDELAGVMAKGKAENPVGLLRSLLRRQRKGEFTPELGPDIRDAREARRRHEERLSRSAAAPAVVPAAQSTAPAVDSAVARHHREQLRQMRAGWK
jgi:hypothetical protein